jgi:hypothetical protein
VPTGAKPYYIAGGEVLGSGRVDLAVVTDPFSLTASSNVSLLTNVNQGTSFTSTAALFTSTMESRVFGPAAIGDLDRDGQSEIIITSLGRFTVMGGPPFASGAFTILSHTGGGSFTTFGPLLARMAYGDLTINDFDRNGRNDLAFVGGANDNMGDNVVDLHLLQGNGTFEEPPLYSGGPRSPLRPTVVSGDLNGDGWPDLILSNPADSGSGTLGVLLNQGNAAFPQAAPVTYPAGAGVLMLAAGDLNGDQRLDVVVTADGDAKGRTPGSLHIYVQAARN